MQGLRFFVSPVVSLLFFFCILSSCTEGNENKIFYQATDDAFSGKIDLNNLENYANQTLPGYITKDNTINNPITNAGATLGRILFYDKNLSTGGTISCASCHQQQNGFSDVQVVSEGVNGVTNRHSMRLINARFAAEGRFFWDERAATLEEQTTMPIQDHAEMGFSGQNGDPSFQALISKMEAIDYYNELFSFTYGDKEITETRIQRALSQFVRSIQSFDSKYDEGRAQVNNNNVDFPNFTAEENLGKTIFLTPPNNNGAGCQGCHRAPEFDIDPNSLNNGIVRIAGSADQIDLTNTKAPSLRDIFGIEGKLNGQLMHNGAFNTLEEVIEHYNSIEILPENTNLDPRLRGGDGQGQQLQLTDTEKSALVAFIKTLSGTSVYTDSRWSDPF